MWKTQFFGRRIWLWFSYVTIVVVVVLIHYRGEIFESGCGGLTWTAKLWHQRMCTAGNRKPRAHYVRVVTLTAGVEPVGDLCAGRKFMAQLLSRLSDLGASVIVIDKWYLRTGCADAGATLALQQSINTISQKIPIIFAQYTETYDESRANSDPNLAQWEKLGLGKNDQVLLDSAITVDGSAAKFGLARLACNNWQIPTRWMVRTAHQGSEAGYGPVTAMDGIAFAAAKTFDGQLAQVMQKKTKQGEDLVTSFLPLESFQPLNATKILCGEPGTKYDPQTCRTPAVAEFPLKGKVIVVGQYAESDWHQTVIGSMPGFALQANYIESLLDDRYYQLIPRWLEILLAVLCFVGIDITIEQARSPHLGALISLAGMAFLWAIAHFAIMEWGFYFTFWFPGIVAIMVKWLDAWNKTLHEKRQPSIVQSPPPGPPIAEHSP
jgi:hypothetical protein